MRQATHARPMPMTDDDPCPRPELIWVGHGGWVACDASVAPDDPGRVLAYVECKDGLVYVLWVRGGGDVAEFDSIRHALDAIDEVAARDHGHAHRA